VNGWKYIDERLFDRISMTQRLILEYLATFNTRLSINQIINFENFISENKIFLKIQYFSSCIFFFFGNFLGRIFNIFENNISNVKVAKVVEH
jgi:hypothetical protein